MASTSATVPSRAAAYAAAAGAAALTLAVVVYPRSAFEASLDGLRLWFQVVLPSLLPFFALAQILMGLGAVHFIGVCLEPLMRPLFRLPGTAAFAVAMGLVSGYPLGAKVTGDLRRNRLCTVVEAERLVAFANTADPLFMSGAVAVGMFAQPRLGAVLAFAHYASVLLVGLVMRFHGYRWAPPAPPPSGPLLRRALDALYQARLRDGRPFGRLFGDVLRDSMSQMLFIGGTITLFSVLLQVATLTGVVHWAAAHLVTPVLGGLGLDPGMADGLTAGFFELDLGSRAAAQAAAPLLDRAVAASAIIAWSGLSVHAQVAAMVHGTGLRMGPYLLARLLHSVLAGVLTVAAFHLGGSFPTLAPTVGPAGAPGFAARFLGATLQAVGVALTLLVTGVLWHLLRQGGRRLFRGR
ncbi:nucleoside recognition domain-containing protein [Limnochorda pilosa]|uniref:Nucleoside recognition protein n=1 Tax=Limnochorda pilosa TaxID=1555112 RepID=A0A0K2SK11_LIMPI|nr:nucleoside recognition domain-containing protein [Limnochorda pilosa]BAS27456.1 nucleoside recognition protein [Limnochorda pilosa]